MTEPNWTDLNDSPLSTIGEDVAVTNPINQGEGRNMHVVYLVVSGGIEARRRYSDFQWLYQRILTEAPGAFVPIIPHKRTALIGEAKYSQEFVEERRGNLQMFMKGVFQIPDINTLSPSLVTFLTAPEDQLDNAKKQVEAANPSLVSTKDMDAENDNVAEAKKGLGNLIAKAKTVTQTKLGNMELLETKDEKEIAALKLYISRVEIHIKELAICTEKLIKSTSDKLIGINDLGVKISEWKFSRDDFLDTTYGPEGRLMDDHQEIPKMMSAVAHFSDEIRIQMEKQAAAERATLEQGLSRLALDIIGFKRALATRRKLQVAYTTKDNQIKQIKKNLEKKKEVDRMSADLYDLEKAASVLKVKLEECSHRLLKESNRVRPVIEARLNDSLKNYAIMQLMFGEKVKKLWDNLMPKFELEGTEEVNGPNTPGKLSTIALSDSGENLKPSAPPLSEDLMGGRAMPPTPPPPVPDASAELVVEKVEGSQDPEIEDDGAPASTPNTE
ncbi:unnamed protein product [Cylindrotheca closterium]|uniref:PX domain-containing protein n=1 Tax=Cylindrotheca closterium TaxID=2856 RepID=A0AAD2G1M9_9STRA|nr:unnamed protein product [Cylindrotheca closterium]